MRGAVEARLSLGSRGRVTIRVKARVSLGSHMLQTRLNEAPLAGPVILGRGLSIERGAYGKGHRTKARARAKNSWERPREHWHSIPGLGLWL